MEDSNFNLETAIASSDVKGIPVTSIMMSDLQWGIQGLQGSQGVDLQPKTLSTCWKILAAAASGLIYTGGPSARRVCDADTNR
eukprot:1160642-Pelagomonas_calceolata.AAC.1